MTAAIRSEAGARPAAVRNTKLGYVAAICAAVISGVSIYVNARTVKTFTDPVLYTAIKDGFVGLALLVPLIFLSGQREVYRKLDRRTWIWLIAIALTGGSIPFALNFTGLKMTTAATGAVLNHLQFVFVALLAAIFLRERIRPVMWFAFVVLLLGTLLGTDLHALNWNGGALLILLSSVFFAIDFVIAKYLLRGLPTLTVMTARMTMGTALLFLYVIAIGHVGGILRLSAGQWELAAFTGFLLLLFTVATFTAIRHASVSTVLAIGAASPIITTLLQVGFAGTLAMTPLDLLGLALIVAAAVVVLVLGVRQDA
ncbi:MAG: DMT family transporter, partial [Candidatus Dormibacteraeota bacterium]|nr:DMT family transporter [Candidatus Dormibacteraeota bacterium]